MLVAAAGYCVLLQLKIVPDTFYTCDAGLKYLQVQQWIRGGSDRWRLDLRLPAQPWVADLWSHGLYPLIPPFVIPQGGMHYINYPPFFSWLAAPWCAALGYRGLYVVPLAATLSIWLTVWRGCRNAGATPSLTAAALAITTLASPLTFYGSTFWEHTLGIALALPAIARLILPPRRTTSLADTCRGALLGFSAWFRPELLLLACLVGALLVLWRYPFRRGGSRWALIGGMLVLLSGAFAYNKGVSGAWFGFRGMQVEAREELWQLRLSMQVLERQMAALIRWFPPLWLILILGLERLVRPSHRIRFVRTDLPLLLIALAQVLLLVIIFPSDGGHEWGPRYYLMTIPASALMLVRWIRDDWVVSGRAARGALGVAVLALLALGSFHNVAGGVRHMHESHALRIAPLYEMLKSYRARVVGTSNPNAVMELAQIVPSTAFFCIRSFGDVAKIGRAASLHGERNVILLMRPQNPPLPDSIDISTPNRSARLMMSPVLRGWVVVYIGRIVPT